MSVLTGLVLVLPVAACGVLESGPSAEDAAEKYLRAFANGDNAAAAKRTNDPKAAKRFLGETRRELSPKKLTTSVREVTEGDNGVMTARFDVSWKLAENRVWRYQGNMKLDRADEGWLVQWAPSVVHPKLDKGQSLGYEVNDATPAPVLDRDGNRIMGPEKLVRVNLIPKEAKNIEQVANSLATGLKPVAPSITAESIVAGANKAPSGQAYNVVTLRWADYQKVKSDIYQLPGVWFPTETELVTAQRDYASQVLPSVADQLGDRLGGRDGWRVFTRDANGEETRTLHSVTPKPGKALSTTLSDKVQSAAEQAVDPEKKPAMIVAMRPSDGGVLAVAQNSAADAKGALSLTGQYPPGSTFKIVTALAALEAGKTAINKPVACPAKKTFNGKVLPNAHNFDLGTVPLREAFAQSCNTTFAQLATELSPNALPDAAKKLGIGADFVIPGITTITGKVPKADQTVDRAVNGIGQGKVLASPFGMALATASVANGSMPVPKLVKGLKTETRADPAPPSAKSLDQLRSMMRAVVESGTATELKGAGKIAGKTGTAQFGDGTHAHGWFVGYRGDMAFAVLMADAGTSERAVSVAKEFLANTQ